MSKMNEHNHSNYSKRIATNTLVLFARMLIITIVNLYTVRWVLKGLGAFRPFLSLWRGTRYFFAISSFSSSV